MIAIIFFDHNNFKQNLGLVNLDLILGSLVN